MADTASSAHTFCRRLLLALARWCFSTSKAKLLVYLVGIHALLSITLIGVRLQQDTLPLPALLSSRQEWIRTSQSDARKGKYHGADLKKRARESGVAELEKHQSGSCQEEWEFSLSTARSIQNHFLETTGRPTPFLKAFIESPLPPPSPQINGNKQGSHAVPKLPSRAKNTPSDLKQATYPRAGPKCQNYQATLPASHPISLDNIFGPTVSNRQPLHPMRFQYANHTCSCGTPVHADPFLPWIHDVFPSDDGTHVNIIAHNKRMCNTDPNHFKDEMKALESQHSLWQPVPIQRVENISCNADGEDGEGVKIAKGGMLHRYRLSSHDRADVDAKETRFICHFYSYEKNKRGETQKVILGETLSTYPYNPERAHYLKPGVTDMVLPPGHKSIKNHIWNSILHAKCPIPNVKIKVLSSINSDDKGDLRSLPSLISSGESVVDGLPTIFFDLVPIRTYPRISKEESYIQGVKSQFDPEVEWGSNHVLPSVEASGRWSALPVCLPPSHNDAGTDKDTLSVDAHSEFQRPKMTNSGGKLEKPDDHKDEKNKSNFPKKYYLTACMWSSASFHTRGSTASDNSTTLRLLEWLTYSLNIAGFDHVYVYDNSGAFVDDNLESSESASGNFKTEHGNSLKIITDLFPSSRVTRIAWPHRVCNNNKPAHSNSGERSSQYAAEASCRIRYGSSTTWMATLDVDEYLIPLGPWAHAVNEKIGYDMEEVGIQKWLRSLDSKKEVDKAYILSFFQTRALPDARKMVTRIDEGNEVLAKNSSLTYLETYDCESTTLPKPSWAWRAQKQIYKPEFVLNHYVHYSAITNRVNTNPREISPKFTQKRPWERRVSELDEAFLLHTKTTLPAATAEWRIKCSNTAVSKNCPVGITHMDRWGEVVLNEHNENIANGTVVSAIDESWAGLEPNCYRHKVVRQNLVSRLEKAMKPYQEKYNQYLND